MKSFASKPYDRRICDLLLAALLTRLGQKRVLGAARLPLALFALLYRRLTVVASFVFQHSTVQLLGVAWAGWMGMGLPDR